MILPYDMLDPKKVNEAFIKVREKILDGELEVIALSIELACKINLEEDLPKISFFNNPIKYIKNESNRNTYKTAIDDVINSLNSKKDIKANYTLHLLNYTKEVGGNIPNNILHEMKRFQK